MDAETKYRTKQFFKKLFYNLAVNIFAIIVGIVIVAAVVAVIVAIVWISIQMSKHMKKKEPEVVYSDDPVEDLNVKTLMYMYPESMLTKGTKEQVISALKNEVNYISPDMMKHWNQLYLNSLKK